MAKARGRLETNGEAPPLRLEWRDPAELADNPKNWRRHPDAQVAALADVIASVGWAGACLYNERTGRLIDGHARKAVAVGQGAKKVPVLVGDWSEEQERLILATLDPLAAMAEADAAALDALLRDVDGGGEAVETLLAGLRDATPRAPTEPANDPAAEWEGMPDLDGEVKAKRCLTIYFPEEKDAEDFARLIGASINGRTKYLWFPREPD